MNIVCLIFDEITALDAVGPYEVLSRIPGASFVFVSPEGKPAATDSRCLQLVPGASMSEVSRCDLLLVPGGFGARKLQHDARVVDWLRAMDARSTLTATVCTGSILLAATGALVGRRATTHWAYYEQLAAHGATPVAERVVRDGKYATAAGVSAGIDLALALVLELRGRALAEAIQLSIEYDPAPVLDAGSPSKVSSALREQLYARSHARDAEIEALRPRPSP